MAKGAYILIWNTLFSFVNTFSSVFCQIWIGKQTCKLILRRNIWTTLSLALGIIAEFADMCLSADETNKKE